MTAGATSAGLGAGPSTGTGAAAAAEGLAAASLARASSRSARRRPSGPLAGLERRWGLILAAPYIFGLLAFVAGPVVFSWTISLFAWDQLTPPRFTGLENWRRLASDPLFWQASRNTVFFVAVTVPVGVALSLALALLVNRPLRGIAVFRTLLFTPVVTSVVAVALVWAWFYDPNYGVLNYLLDRAAKLLGHRGMRPIAWLNDPATALPAIMAMTIWKGLGYNMVIFLAALQDVPQSLYEAADLDGAGRWGKFRHVTLPTISPVSFFVVAVGTIGAFQVFDQVYVMAREGRPANSTLTLVYYLYRSGFQNLEMGYASCIGTALFAAVLAVTLVQLAAQRRWVHTQ